MKKSRDKDPDRRSRRDDDDEEERTPKSRRNDPKSPNNRSFKGVSPKSSMRGTASLADDRKKPSSKKGKKKKKKPSSKRQNTDNSWDEDDMYEDPFDTTQAINDRIRGNGQGPKRARDRYFLPNDMP